ncbi:hypothetical protein BgiMline_010043, partial [Biomphalaria glabrata]
AECGARSTFSRHWISYKFQTWIKIYFRSVEKINEQFTHYFSRHLLTIVTVIVCAISF